MVRETAEEVLEQRIGQRGTTLPELTLAQGIRLMRDFYRDVRADDCKLDEDGDMLLFQWGTYDWGDGRSFQCDITRQFIGAQPEDEYEDPPMSQLSLTFHFPPSAQFDAIKSGSRWCQRPGELPDFEAFVTGSAAYTSVHAVRPAKVTLRHGPV